MYYTRNNNAPHNDEYVGPISSPQHNLEPVCSTVTIQRTEYIHGLSSWGGHTHPYIINHCVIYIYVPYV